MKRIIGYKLKKLRLDKGWSQEKVADMLYISQSTYARIESGENNTWAAYISKLCDVFDISLDDLLNLDKNITNELIFNKSSSNFEKNGLLEKLLYQYELRLQEKDRYINILEELLNNIKHRS